MLGPDAKDDKKVVIPGRKVTYGKDRIEYEADRKHREKMLGHFGMDKRTKALSTNGEKDSKVEEGDEVELEKDESTIYRGVAARLNFLGWDCPDCNLGVSHRAGKWLIQKLDLGNV